VGPKSLAKAFAGIKIASRIVSYRIVRRTNNLSAYTLSSSRACSEYLAIHDVINFVWFERRWRPIDQCADTIINWLHRGRRHPCTKDALSLGARQYQAAGALACARRCSTSLQQYGHGTRGPLWENMTSHRTGSTQHIATLPEKDRVTATINMLRIFVANWTTCCSETCSQTDRQTEILITVLCTRPVAE